MDGTNPILTELQGLSPGAQQALLQAHQSASATPPMQPPKIAAPGLQAPSAPPPAMMGASMTPPAHLSLGMPPAPPAQTPIGEQTNKDETERSRLLDTGSGIHQIHNPVLKGLAGVGDAIGHIAAPGLMQQIPGTGEHHEQLLGRTNKNLAGDLDVGQKEATTAETQARLPNLNAATSHTQAETAGLPQEQADKHALVDPTVEHINAETDSLEHPKDEWKELGGFSGASGEPLEINSRTGETRPTSATGAKSTKVTTPAQETYDSLVKGGATPMQAYEKIREKPGGTTINQGTWSVQEDGEGKPMLFNSKTGETKAAPTGMQKAGTFAKGEAKTAPEKAALEYANDYVKRTVHTGPGDEALMEKFFELAKPSTGFRMSQPQLDMLKNAQSWMGGFEAHLRHATTGTWFSDEQRQQIAGTMADLAKAKGLGGSQDGQQPSGKGVSLNDARQLPQYKGKSDDEITADIKKYGHAVLP